MKLSLHSATVAYPVNVTARQQSAFAAAARAVSFGQLGRANNMATYVMALNNVSLNVDEGSRIALIGRNGSGKSTLLRTLAGIITPRTGKRFVNGSIGCVLNIGVGLEVDRSGIDNLRMIARLYGMEGRELRNTVDEAADFTELGHFLDLPVRTYSSGMMARLSFSIATARHADIMLVDEVIGAGDAHFVSKAVNRIKDICNKAGALVIASHDQNILSQFCDQAVWMNAGVVRQTGPLDEVWKSYEAM